MRPVATERRIRSLVRARVDNVGERCGGALAREAFPCVVSLRMRGGSGLALLRPASDETMFLSLASRVELTGLLLEST